MVEHVSGTSRASINTFHSETFAFQLSTFNSKLFLLGQIPQSESSQAAPLSGAGKLRVAVLGFGTVARSVAKILVQNPNGPFVVTHIYNRNVEKRRVDWVPGSVRWTEKIEDVLSSDADVIVELIGGLDPAGDWVTRALESGKSVVTANKLLIADRGADLARLARKMGQRIEFGASVAGGIPAIIAIEEGLAGDRLLKIAGILNGTCNYILTQMEAKGTGFDAALKEAQQLGYAEADPSGDVNGYDARAKLVILTQIGLHVQVRSDQVRCWPISTIQAVDLAYAGELRCTIRQISLAEKDPSNPSRIFAAVQPALIPLTSLLAHVQGSQNMVMATGEYGGRVVLSGFGAGGDPTAVAVVSDLHSILRRRGAASAGQEGEMQIPEVVSAELTVPHYLRFIVRDRPGIVAEVSATLARHNIGIDALVQKPGYPRTALPFIMTLESCSSAVLNRALEEIGAMDFHVEPPLCLPILPE